MERHIPTRASWAAPCAALWCATFAGLHLFWAFGGSAGLASSAGRDLAARRPTWFVVFGLYGVALVLLVGVGLIATASATQLGRWRRLVVALLSVVGLLLLLRGVGLELALAANVGGIRAQVGPTEVHWSQILWNPWFALGGASFIVASLQLRRCPYDPAASR
ncbi:hypothetical protein GCM10011519_05580 [Marmoricola endophyticus]|uniref:DUF3995 domain-containing protein n=1 Tax=Marmoricola endophyticus TaxID=2040280 RepID=A0A917BBH7_9ACTN|nr:DUF3995 domain-containing protein [Marmoricola endophyticus]GGF35012.1 hypothetical protein GCM10011519_05580 [Marmoricola endophyticus]